ncbi:MAG: YraN family protein [Magnetococcales bacterium]|nr:YraN family protein [Magnetococcales bacterium]
MTRVSAPAAPDQRRAFGLAAERQAVDYLEQRGWQILACNVRSRLGEIDIIAHHQQTVIFCEVRARHAGAMVSPAESVDRRKQTRLVRLASQFLARYPQWADAECRFDVLSLWYCSNDSWQIEWIEDAFRPGW